MRYLKSNQGITLIEIVIVVVIIGIMAAVASPYFEKAIERIEFKSKTKNMVSMLRLARSYAISQKTPYGVYVDVDNNCFGLFREDANVGSFTFDTGADSLLKIDTLTGGYNYVWASFPTYAVIFEPNGTASESGWIYFGHYTETLGSHSGMSVLASTGKAKVEYLVNY